MVAASVCFAIMGAFTKVGVPRFGLMTVVFWRSIFVTVVTVVLAVGFKASLTTRRHGLLFFRSLVGFVAMLCFFRALGNVPLATATTLLYTSPIFIVLLSGALLAEERPRGMFGLVLLAFVGIVCVFQPDAGKWSIDTFLALLAGFLAALAYMAVRRLRETESAEAVVAYFGVFSVIACLPFVDGAWVPENLEAWGISAGIGLGATGGQLCMTRAYHLERASVVGPLSYATVVFSWLLGVFVFEESLELLALVGVLLVVASGVLVSRRAHAEAPPAPGRIDP